MNSISKGEKKQTTTLGMLYGFAWTYTYLYFNNFDVFVPVPDRQHVLIGIINHTQKCPSILCQNIQQ